MGFVGEGGIIERQDYVCLAEQGMSVANRISAKSQLYFWLSREENCNDEPFGKQHLKQVQTFPDSSVILLYEVIFGSNFALFRCQDRW